MAHAGQLRALSLFDVPGDLGPIQELPMTITRRSWTGVTLGIALALVVAPSTAQDPGNIAEMTKRYANEGVAAYQKGDYATAADKLERANNLLPAPTVGLWLARSLDKGLRIKPSSSGSWRTSPSITRRRSRLTPKSCAGNESPAASRARGDTD